MPTLRQKVDAFCKEAGAEAAADTLRNQVGMLKQELKKLKDTHKHQLHLAKAAAKTKKAPKVAKPPKSPKVKTRKLTEEEKGQAKREKAVTKELAKAAKAPKPKQEVAMQPLPAAMPQTATVATAGRRTRRHRRRRY